MIRRAYPEDIPAINELLGMYGIAHVPASVCDDVSLVYVADDRVVGFVWAGVTASKHLAYIDYLTVHPDHRGAGLKLTKAILDELSDKKVINACSVITKDETNHSARSHNICFKMGMKLHDYPYSFFQGKIQDMVTKWAQ